MPCLARYIGTIRSLESGRDLERGVDLEVLGFFIRLKYQNRYVDYLYFTDKASSYERLCIFRSK